MAMMTATSMVATRMNATGKGPYFAPRPRDRNTPTTNWANTATSGDFHRGWTWAKALGKTSRIGAMAYHVRAVAFEAAFALEMAVSTMARNTSTHPAPETFRARKAQR